MATKRRRKNPSSEARYRLHDGTVVSATGLRRMFMGKIPGPKHRKLLGIERVTEIKRNPDTDIRQGPPRVIRAPAYISGPHVEYCIVGTPYGYLHSINGDVAVFKTLRAANARLKKYVGVKRNPSAPKRRATARRKILTKSVAASKRNMRTKGKARTLAAALRAQGLLLTTAHLKAYGTKSRAHKAISRGYFQESRRKRAR